VHSVSSRFRPRYLDLPGIPSPARAHCASHTPVRGKKINTGLRDRLPIEIIETWRFEKMRLSSLVAPASPRDWIVRSLSSGLPIDRHCRAAEPVAAAVILYDNSRYRSGRPQQEQRE
jgi:hypothetical protein